MSRRLIKSELLGILQENDVENVFSYLDKHPSHLLLNPLFIALCSCTELVRWQAIRGFGHIVPAMAGKDPEAARVVMRRLLWSLNDESGGIGWGAPEAMAEIMVHSTLLRQEYLHMLISYMRRDGEELFQDGNYLELPLLQRGLLWGVGRLCQVQREEMRGRHIVDDLLAYLSSPDHQVIGLALWCLGQVADKRAAAIIEGFLNHPGVVQVYLDNGMATFLVGQLAADALRQLHGPQGEILTLSG